MTDVRIMAGTLTANREDRTVAGMLLPFGEEGRTNLGRFQVPPDRVQVPGDPIVVGLNVEHDREQPVGRASTLTATGEGITAAFTIAATPEGDDVLDGVESGERAALSAEIADVVIRDGVLVSGRLFGAAVCEQGAFPSATVYASDVGDLPEDSGASAPVTTDQTREADAMGDATTADGATLEAEAVTITTDAEVTQTYDDGSAAETITEVVHDEVTYETQPSPGDTQDAGAAQASEQDADAATAAEENPEDAVEASSTAQEETTVTTDTLTASAPAGSLAARTTRTRSTLYASGTLGDVAKHLAAAYNEGGKQTLLAALSDVVPGDILGAIVPAYLGELWSGATQARRYVPLVENDTLRARKMKAWRWVTKPVVQAYAGNKGPIPSGGLETEEVEITAQALAVGHDIDRSFVDFGDDEFFRSYFAAVTESYAEVSDQALLDALVDGVGDVIEPGTLASGIPAGWGMVVDGAIKVQRNTKAPATFAVVDFDLYRDMLLTPQDAVLPLLSAALRIPEGEAASFPLLPSDDVPAGSVLVGTRRAATFYELPGASPVRVEALDLVNGGVDHAAHGYYAVNIAKEGGLVLVTEESSV